MLAHAGITAAEHGTVEGRAWSQCSWRFIRLGENHACGYGAAILQVQSSGNKLGAALSRFLPVTHADQYGWPGPWPNNGVQQRPGLRDARIAFRSRLIRRMH